MAIPAFTQSQPAIYSGDSQQPLVIPGSVVRGFVLDEDGNPVPNAIVTLWQDSKIWQHGKVTYIRADNPQTSAIHSDVASQSYDQTGLFWFGLVEPGQYTVTAEKDGYKGSTGVSVGNDTINMSLLSAGESSRAVIVTANITLSGYHVPVLSQEQLSYAGAIVGTIKGRYGTRVGGVNVSLWQNGQIVNMQKNPQASYIRNVSGREIDYIFEHLAPGQYQVMAEYSAPDTRNDSVSVNVSTGTETADIVLSQLFLIPPSFSPTSNGSVVPTGASAGMPTPFPGIITILLLIGMTIILIGKFRKFR